MWFFIIFVLFTSVKNETYSLKRFYFLLCLQIITAKNRWNKRHLLQILSKNIMILIIINNQINNANPTMQCLRRTYKKIILVKYLQYIIFKLFSKTMSFFNEKHSYFTCTINKHAIWFLSSTTDNISVNIYLAFLTKLA